MNLVGSKGVESSTDWTGSRGSDGTGIKGGVGGRGQGVWVGRDLMFSSFRREGISQIKSGVLGVDRGGAVGRRRGGSQDVPSVSSGGLCETGNPPLCPADLLGERIKTDGSVMGSRSDKQMNQKL